MESGATCFLSWIFYSRRSRRRQSALISEEKKLAPTDLGGYTLRPFSAKCEVFGLDHVRKIHLSTDYFSRVRQYSVSLTASADAASLGLTLFWNKMSFMVRKSP